MLRRIGFLLLVCFSLLGICLPAAAQMTDDAVIEYVKDGL